MMMDVDIVTQFNNEEAKRNRRHRKKERVKTYIKAYLATHPCISCGATDNLTFHHRNPKEKRMGIARLISYKSIAAIQLEIDKCDVLCRACHDIEHNIRRNDEDE
jgi:5-methylcytosine-specific restriction endonuclease McrA